MSHSHTLPVTIHGRYLVEPPAFEPAALLVGFHGYAEDAETQLARLQSIPGADAWIVASIQGLHRFYRGRERTVVASWMTRQDRELLIADNLAYVATAVEAIRREHRAEDVVVFAGFSQGVAMAFRAACAARLRVGGVIAAGGDVPPELTREALARIPTVLLGRGEGDDLYAAGQWARDATRLNDAGVNTETLAYEGRHEWTPAFSRAAGVLLNRASSDRIARR